MYEVDIGGKRQWKWTDHSEVVYTEWDVNGGFDGKPTGTLKCATYRPLKSGRAKKGGLWRYVECDEVQYLGVCKILFKEEHVPEGSKTLFNWFENGRIVRRPLTQADRERIKALSLKTRSH